MFLYYFKVSGGKKVQVRAQSLMSLLPIRNAGLPTFSHPFPTSSLQQNHMILYSCSWTGESNPAGCGKYVSSDAFDNREEKGRVESDME